MNYYCKQWGNEIGPLTSSDVRSMASTGAIRPDHFIRAENSDRWVTADSIPNLFTAISPSLPPAAEALTNQRGASPHTTIVVSNKKTGLLAVVAVLGSTTVLLALALGFLLLRSMIGNSPNVSLNPPVSNEMTRSQASVQQNQVVAEESTLKPAQLPIVSRSTNNQIQVPQKPLYQPPPAPAPPKTYRTGEIAIAAGLGYSVAASRWSDRLSDNPLMDTTPRASYLIVGLVVVNGNSEPYVLPPLHLVDEKGTEYSTSPNSIWMKDAIGPIENLNPEVPLSGFIAFDVPRNHRYRLEVRGGMWSTEKAYIVLDPK